MTARHTVAAAVGATAILAGAAPAAQAEAPSTTLTKQYLKHYKKAEQADQQPGRNIVEDGVRKQGERRAATEREVRRSLRVLKRMVAAPTGSAAASGSAASGALQSIAACESGGDPTAVDASGTYRGKYQFDMQTWQSVGGSGDPAAASEAEQDMRAQQLMNQRGSSPWPVCGG